MLHPDIGVVDLDAAGAHAVAAGANPDDVRDLAERTALGAKLRGLPGLFAGGLNPGSSAGADSLGAIPLRPRASQREEASSACAGLC